MFGEIFDLHVSGAYKHLPTALESKKIDILDGITTVLTWLGLKSSLICGIFSAHILGQSYATTSESDCDEWCKKSGENSFQPQQGYLES